MNVPIGVLLVPLVLLTVWLAWWSPKSRRPLELDPSPHGALVVAHRKAVGWRWAGLGLGVVVASVGAMTVSAGLHNLGAMLSPTFGSIRLHGIACPPASWTILGVALLAVGALTLLLTACCLASLLAVRPLTPVESGGTAVAIQGVRR